MDAFSRTTIAALIAGLLLAVSPGCSDRDSSESQARPDSTGERDSDSAAEQPDPGPRRVNLAPTFVEGATVTYENLMKTRQRRTMEILNERDETNATLRRRFTFTVLETLDDGGARVELTFDRIVMDVTPPNSATFFFDSAAAPPESEADALEAMLIRVSNHPVVLRLSPTGEAVELERPRALKETIGFESVARNLGILFSESWYQGVATEAFCVAFDEPRRVIGETWTSESVSNVGGMRDRTTTMTYTLESADEGIAAISGRGELDAKVGETISIEGAPAEVLDEHVEFNVRWDIEAGRLAEYETSQTLRLAVGETSLGAEFLIELFTDVAMERIADRDSESADAASPDAS